jgi:nicotinate-nucleotide--dimethylbenzimidazole phosphoribosyltransferase
MTPPPPLTRAAIQHHLDSLAKPKGSLALLETWALRACALQGTLQPSFPSAAVIVFAADHGVTAARPQITAFPRSVTVALLKAVARGLPPASAALAAACGFGQAEYVDVGCDDTVQGAPPSSEPLLADKRVVMPASSSSSSFAVHTCGSSKVSPQGTADLTRGAAMTRAELRQALEAGREAVRRAVRRAKEDETGGQKPLSAIALGEMGLGNTTSAAALAAALTGARPEEVCGRGTGVDDAGLQAKRQAVSDALEVNKRLIDEGEEEEEEGEEEEATTTANDARAEQQQQHQQRRALRALRAVGGLELAAIAGAVWECSDQGIAVLVDGFICSAAALAAVSARPRAARCLFPSHASAELGAARVLSELDAAIRQAGEEEPPLSSSPLPLAPLDMALRLGEATGAILALPLLRASAALVQDTALLSDVLDGGGG